MVIDDDGKIKTLKEAQKVFPSLTVKMPKEKPKSVDPPKPKDGLSSKPAISMVPKKTLLDISSIPGYKEVEQGVMKDKEGKHKEAMKLYKKAGELGNKAAFLNMGNCYMFGKGVEQDKKKGIEMYGKCGQIGDDELGWMRELSNDRFVCGKKLDLYGLFFIKQKIMILLDI